MNYDIIVNKYVKLRLDSKNALTLIALSVICVVLYYFKNYYAMAINVAVVGCSSLALNRGMIKSVLKSIKAKFLG